MHSCKKAGHSCMRNVISFIKLPGRKAFKTVGRAARCVLFAVWNTWAFRDQACCGADMCSRYNDTRARNKDDNTSCVKCGCAMHTPGAATADAGQAYEALSRPFVNKSVDNLFTNAVARCKSGDMTVSVFKTTTFNACLGGRTDSKCDDRTVLWISKIRKSIKSLLAMCVYRVGNVFIRQESGIPIGGPVSGVILEICCEVLEHRFDTYTWPSKRDACALKGARKEYIAAARYADDTAMASKWFCSGCLENFIIKTYKNEISFDITSECQQWEDFIALKFLDFILYADFMGAQTGPHTKNELAIWLGKPDLRIKLRFPPLYGKPVQANNRLRIDLCGRIARYRVLKAHPTSIALSLAADFVELSSLGYTSGAIRKAWFSIPDQDAYVHVGWKVLDALRPELEAPVTGERTLHYSALALTALSKVTMLASTVWDRAAYASFFLLIERLENHLENSGSTTGRPIGLHMHVHSHFWQVICARSRERTQIFILTIVALYEWHRHVLTNSMLAWWANFYENCW